jgi:ABC-type maltose transport system permease subunit
VVVLLGYISLKIFDLVFVMTRGGPGVSCDFPSILLFDSAGYILSKWRFRGADTLFAVLLFGMFIPYQAILIPLVNLLQQLHLYDSLVGLAVTNIV